MNPFIKNCLAIFLVFSCFQITFSQASMIPQKKNFLIEKGTGHVCGSCPDIAKKCDTVIDSHMRRGMLIEYHFGPDAKPQAGSLTRDWRTAYGDTIFEPTAWNWPFYLNMMVNRKDRGAPYGSTFIFGPSNNQVQPEADAVINENSPVNLYMKPTYDGTKRELTIETELFYTADAATNTNFLQIAITEDSIIGTQYDPLNYPLNSGFNLSFNHTNVFRDNINGLFGDTIKTTTKNSLVKKTYKYTFPTSYRNIPCNPLHCNLTMYIADARNNSGVQSFTGKIINAIRADTKGKSLTEGNGTESTSSLTVVDNNFSIYPNPSNGIIKLINSKFVERFVVEIYNLFGQKVFQKELNSIEENTLNLTELPKGNYLAKVKSIAFNQSLLIQLAE